jgi:hypothetical protein
MNNASKGRCVTITPSGIVEASFRREWGDVKSQADAR